MIRRLLPKKGIGFALALALLVAACAPPVPLTQTTPPPPDATAQSSAEALSPVRVCYSALSGNQITVWYAFEKGLFAEHGLEVDLSNFDSGANAAAAMAADEVDICQMGGANAVNLTAAGEDAVVIAGLINTLPHMLMVRPEIKTADDLRGGALAVGSFGASADIASRTILLKLGLEPDKDVAIIAIGGQGENLAAMAAGAVQGTLISVPQTVQAAEMGFHPLLNVADMGFPYPHTSLVVSRAYLASHRPEVRAFLAAILDGLEQMKQDEAGVKEVMAKYMELDPEKDAVALDEAYREIVGKFLTLPPYPTLEGLQIVIDEVSKENPDAAKFKPADLVDTSLLDELVKQ